MSNVNIFKDSTVSFDAIPVEELTDCKLVDAETLKINNQVIRISDKLFKQLKPDLGFDRVGCDILINEYQDVWNDVSEKFNSEVLSNYAGYSLIVRTDGESSKLAVILESNSVVAMMAKLYNNPAHINYYSYSDGEVLVSINDQVITWYYPSSRYAYVVGLRNDSVDIKYPALVYANKIVAKRNQYSEDMSYSVDEYYLTSIMDNYSVQYANNITLSLREVSKFLSQISEISKVTNNWLHDVVVSALDTNEYGDYITYLSGVSNSIERVFTKLSSDNYTEEDMLLSNNSVRKSIMRTSVTVFDILHIINSIVSRGYELITNKNTPAYVTQVVTHSILVATLTANKLYLLQNYDFDLEDLGNLSTESSVTNNG